MSLTLFALPGAAIGVASVTLLYLRWRGALAQPGVVAGAWALAAVSVALWTAALTPDVGSAVAVLVFIGVALVLVIRKTDLTMLARFPGTRRSPAEPVGRVSWGPVTARALSALVAAPLVGMTLGLAAWVWAPGHDATRFFWAVFGFLIAFAGIQIWGLSARRPWRALGLIALVGIAAALPVNLGLR